MKTTALFGPVQNDLPTVEARLQAVAGTDYPLLAELLGQVLQTSGKRVRPALTLLAGRPYCYDLDLLVPMAAAVELLHTATLVHDDTVDNARTRRGTPTVNSVWSNGAAVLLGDYLFAQSAVLTASTNNLRVMTIFAETLMVICKGEVREVFAAGDPGQSIDDYYARIDGKTASLLAMACHVGAILGGAPEADVNALRGYGYHLGMAFQIVDDILDFIGNEHELGKPVGNDLRQGTMTLPTLLALKRSPAANPISDLLAFGVTDAAVSRAVAAVRDSGAIDEAYATALDFADIARASLALLAESEARITLEGLAEYVVRRRV